MNSGWTRTQSQLRGSFVAGAVLTLALLTSAGGAQAAAGETDQRAAKALFREAVQLFKQGKFDQACPMFSRSQRIHPQIGTALNLALCHKEEGKLASAWYAYENAASLAKQKGDPREGKARQGAAELSKRLGYIAIRGNIPKGLTITLDGQPLAPAAWEMVPVDAGAHAVRLNATSCRPRTETIVTRDGVTLTWNIPPLEELTEGGGPGVPRREPTRPPAPRPTPVPPDTDDPGRTHRLLAIVSGGLGLVGLGLGVGFTADMASKVQASSPECSSRNVCTERGYQLRSDAGTSATVGFTGFALGVVGLTGAAVFWLTAPQGNGEQGTGEVRPGLKAIGFNPAPGAWGLLATGQW